MRQSSKPVVAVIAMVAVVILVGGAALSILKRDAKWMDRTGAVLSAFAALAILYQIQYEIDLERKFRKLEREARAREPRSTDPLKEVELRLAENQWKRDERVIVKQRLEVAAAVVWCAFFGEILAGFGGDAIRSVLPHVFR